MTNLNYLLIGESFIPKSLTEASGTFIGKANFF